MPVRSLNSSVLKWPDRSAVDKAIRQWSKKVGSTKHGIEQIGYFGSYARGDWGVGSDLDIVIIVGNSDKPFEARGREWNTAELPVPADVLVYTREEWQSLIEQSSFLRTIAAETIWVFPTSKQ